MGAGFKTDINSALSEQALILGPHGSDGVHLSVRASATAMPPFAYNASAVNNNRSDHRIREGIQLSLSRQLQAPPHIFLVLGHKNS